MESWREIREGGGGSDSLMDFRAVVGIDRVGERGSEGEVTRLLF